MLCHKRHNMDEIINFLQHKKVDISFHKIYTKMTVGHTDMAVPPLVSYSGMIMNNKYCILNSGERRQK